MKHQRYCSHPSCSNTVTDAMFCSIHQKNHNDSNARLNSSDRGYNGRWHKISKLFLQTNPICQQCKSNASILVHHILPISNGGKIFDMDNLLAVCKACHDSIHYKINQQSYYINQHA